MKDTTQKNAPAQYREIAADIARRVVTGEFTVGDKLYGRSLMSSEYSVSPETIRRAFRLLEDMKVLEVRPQSGARILSVDSARHYLEGSDEAQKGSSLRARLWSFFRSRTSFPRRLDRWQAQ